MYKPLGKTDGCGCNQVLDPNTDDILSCVAASIMLGLRRQGHMNEKGLRVMHIKGMVEGILDCLSEFDLYEHCIYGK